MTRDLNKIMEAVREQRDVYVTADGTVEDAATADQNAAREEGGGEAEPKARTKLKPEVFGVRA